MLIFIDILISHFICSDAVISVDGSSNEFCNSSSPCSTLEDALIKQTSPSDLHTVTFINSQYYTSGVFDAVTLSGRLKITSDDDYSKTVIQYTKLITIIDPTDSATSLIIQNITFIAASELGFINSTSSGTIDLKNVRFQPPDSSNTAKLTGSLLTSSAGSIHIDHCQFQNFTLEVDSLVFTYSTNLVIDGTTSFSYIACSNASSALYANIPMDGSISLNSVTFSHCTGVPYVCGGAVEVILGNSSSITTTTHSRLTLSLRPGVSRSAYELYQDTLSRSVHTPSRSWSGYVL